MKILTIIFYRILIGIMLFVLFLFMPFILLLYFLRMYAMHPMSDDAIKLLLILYALLCLFLIAISGCATFTKPIIPVLSEYIEEKKQKEQEWFIQLEKIEKRKQKKIVQKERQKQFLSDERNIILKSFSNSASIIKAFEKLGYSIFDIATFLNEYGKNDIDGFCEFLSGYDDVNGKRIGGKFPFNTKAMWFLNREIFIPVKRNYELLKRLSKENEKE